MEPRQSDVPALPPSTEAAKGVSAPDDAEGIVVNTQIPYVTTTVRDIRQLNSLDILCKILMTIMTRLSGMMPGKTNSPVV